VRSSLSSQHSRPPHYLSSARQEDELLLREWLLVLKGDGESPRTIENYRGSVGMLVGFLAAGGSPCSCSDANGNLRDSSRTPTTQCPATECWTAGLVGADQYLTGVAMNDSLGARPLAASKDEGVGT